MLAPRRGDRERLPREVAEPGDMGRVRGEIEVAEGGPGEALREGGAVAPQPEVEDHHGGGRQRSVAFQSAQKLPEAAPKRGVGGRHDA